MRKITDPAIVINHCTVVDDHSRTDYRSWCDHRMRSHKTSFGNIGKLRHTSTRVNYPKRNTARIHPSMKEYLACFISPNRNMETSSYMY